MKLFIYGTLKKRRILEEALGERHGKKLIPATVFGYLEKPVMIDHISYPTLWSMGKSTQTKGDIIEVSEKELQKLDSWEEKYGRRPVETSAGPAWTYIMYAPRTKNKPLWPKT